MPRSLFNAYRNLLREVIRKPWHAFVWLTAATHIVTRADAEPIDSIATSLDLPQVDYPAVVPQLPVFKQSLRLAKKEFHAALIEDNASQFFRLYRANPQLGNFSDLLREAYRLERHAIVKGFAQQEPYRRQIIEREAFRLALDDQGPLLQQLHRANATADSQYLYLILEELGTARALNNATHTQLLTRAFRLLIDNGANYNATYLHTHNTVLSWAIHYALRSNNLEPLQAVVEQHYDLETQYSDIFDMAQAYHLKHLEIFEMLIRHIDFAKYPSVHFYINLFDWENFKIEVDNSPESEGKEFLRKINESPWKDRAKAFFKLNPNLKRFPLTMVVMLIRAELEHAFYRLRRWALDKNTALTPAAMVWKKAPPMEVFTISSIIGLFIIRIFQGFVRRLDSARVKANAKQPLQAKAKKAKLKPTLPITGRRAQGVSPLTKLWRRSVKLVANVKTKMQTWQTTPAKSLVLSLPTEAPEETIQHLKTSKNKVARKKPKTTDSTQQIRHAISAIKVLPKATQQLEKSPAPKIPAAIEEKNAVMPAPSIKPELPKKPLTQKEWFAEGGLHASKEIKLPEEVDEIFSLLVKSGKPNAMLTLVAGGLLRDTELNTVDAKTDIDVVTAISPADLRQILLEIPATILDSSRLFRLQVGKRQVDIWHSETLAGAYDSVYEAVYADAMQRDFTVNALYGIPGYLFDPTELALKALQASAPLASLMEDQAAMQTYPLRILRAVYYSNKLSKDLSSPLQAAMQKHKHRLKEVLTTEASILQYNSQLTKLFTSPNFENHLQDLTNLEITSVMFGIAVQNYLAKGDAQYQIMLQVIKLFADSNCNLQHLLLYLLVMTRPIPQVQALEMHFKQIPDNQDKLNQLSTYLAQLKNIILELANQGCINHSLLGQFDRVFTEVLGNFKNTAFLMQEETRLRKMHFPTLGLPSLTLEDDKALAPSSSITSLRK